MDEAVALGFDRAHAAAVAFPAEVAGVRLEAVALEDHALLAPQQVDAVLQDRDLAFGGGAGRCGG